VAVLIGFLGGLLCYLRLASFHDHAADFTLPLYGARYLLAGQNPYTTPYPVDAPLYYPLPAVLVALPLAGLPDVWAGAVFFGISSGLLAFGLLRDGWYRLILFLSAPYLMALGWAQWPPFVMATILLPWLYPLAICKPNIGLPLMATFPSRRGILLSVGILLASLLVLPSWPLGWWANLGQNRHVAPLLVMPGILLLLALIRWRTPEARMLVILAILPQRLFFSDQLVLWLIPSTARTTLLLTLASWLGFFGWISLADGSTTTSPFWVVTFVYLPALALVLWPLVQRKKQPQPALG
jgi:hypothetical protein